MNVLLTGCLGHIGSYLLIKLLKKTKLHLYGLDSNASNNLNTIFNLKKKNFTFFLDDLRNFEYKKKIKKIDFIIHLASTTNAEMSLVHKKEYEKNNLVCFNKVVEISNFFKCKLIHISSTSIYGVSSNLVNESLEKKFLKPQSPYAAIKLKEENILKNNKNINFVTLRFGTIVGTSSGMRFHTAVNKFCLAARFEKPIPVWKFAYNQYRPYLSIKDAYKTIVFFLNNSELFNNDTYNVVTNNFTVAQIIKKIQKTFKKKIKIKFVYSKIMNQLSYKVSGEKIKNIGLYLSNDIDIDIKNTKYFLG
jgi:nucleoside-diphosphate-sugar epimerase